MPAAAALQYYVSANERRMGQPGLKLPSFRVTVWALLARLPRMMDLTLSAGCCCCRPPGLPKCQGEAQGAAGAEAAVLPRHSQRPAHPPVRSPRHSGRQCSPHSGWMKCPEHTGDTWLELFSVVSSWLFTDLWSARLSGPLPSWATVLPSIQTHERSST